MQEQVKQIATIIALIVAVLATQVVQENPTSAQSDPEVLWVLVDTVFEPKEAKYDSVISGGTAKGSRYKRTITETQFWREDHVEYDRITGEHLVMGDWLFQIDFDKPPKEMRPGETIELHASGKATWNGVDLKILTDRLGRSYSAGTMFRYSAFRTRGKSLSPVQETYLDLGFDLWPLRDTWEGSTNASLQVPSTPASRIDSLVLSAGVKGQGVVYWFYQKQEGSSAATPQPRATQQPQERTSSSPPTTIPSPKPAGTASGPLLADCSIDQGAFDRDWKKYSDFDDRIPLNDRSFEAREWAKVAAQIVDKKVESFILQRDMEIDRLMRLDMREYRRALVQNLKVNLLKSFWRLAWVTYDTIAGKPGFGSGSLGLKGGAMGLGESYSLLFTSSNNIEKLGVGLKVVRGLMPGDSRYAINTTEVSGKVKSVGASVALDALEKLGDPKQLAQTLYSETAQQLLPATADLSEEEIKILKTQHLEKRLLDEVLQDSYRLNSERRRAVEAIQAEVAELERELASWEAAEKDRVARSLVSGCQAQNR